MLKFGLTESGFVLGLLGITSGLGVEITVGFGVALELGLRTVFEICGLGAVAKVGSFSGVLEFGLTGLLEA